MAKKIGLEPTHLEVTDGLANRSLTKLGLLLHMDAEVGIEPTFLR